MGSPFSGWAKTKRPSVKRSDALIAFKIYDLFLGPGVSRQNTHRAFDNQSLDQNRATVKSAGLYIQYVGFDVAPASRVYTFHVIDAPYAARDFTVNVQSEAFHPDRLSLQDGPGICYARLVQELGEQTAESRAEACLNIGERDIREYLDQHRPKKPQTKVREASVPPPDNTPVEWWRRR